MPNAWDMANKKPRFDSDKLLDPSLADFAEQDSSERVSVIVELALPPSQVELANQSADEGLAPYAVLPFDVDAERRGMDRLEAELRKLGQDQFVRLDVAQAFVVDLNSEQLRAVTQLAEAGCIRPNRTHQV